MARFELWERYSDGASVTPLRRVTFTAREVRLNRDGFETGRGKWAQYYGHGEPLYTVTARDRSTGREIEVDTFRAATKREALRLGESAYRDAWAEAIESELNSWHCASRKLDRVLCK